jgi:RNA polymerase sigma factor (sigma-70 family)
MRTELQLETAGGGRPATPARGGLGESSELDLTELYRAISKQLERIVRFGVCAPDLVIEEACQSAWERLIDHQAQVRKDSARSWLVKTAVREAFRLLGLGSRERSLEAELEERGELVSADPRPGLVDRYEQRERLSAIASLSRRQQRLLWLYGLGLTYEEIATRDGCTARTVERQLKRARETLREV